MGGEKGCSLLIPVRVRAFLAGKAPKKDMYSDFSYDFSQLGNISYPIEMGLFSRRDQQPGVHLHWNLPECFAHGIQDEKTKEVEYRLAPNRWTVTRLWSVDETQPLNAKTFLVESDALLEDAEDCNNGSPTWPYVKGSGQYFRYLGRWGSADKRMPDAPEHIRLTAVSPVNPFFAAYYPMCRNVFGFFDDLPAEGLEHVNLCYLVCGWYYEDGEAEPFSEITSLTELEEQFGLTADTKEWPQRTICQGIIDCLRWETKDTYYHSGLPDDPEPGEVVEMPRLAIGNNSAEAISALPGGSGSDDERLMCYFLHNIDPMLNERGGVINAEQSLHGAAFSTDKPYDVPGIKRQPGCEDSGPPNATTMDQLAELRARQRSLYNDYAIFLQKQRSVYENWYLHIYSDAPYDIYYMRMMQLHMQEAFVYSSALQKRAAKLKEDINNFNPGKGYELYSEPDEPFRIPNEPVLVVSQPAASSNRNTEGSLLRCRVSSGIVAEMILPDVAGYQVTLDGNVLCPKLQLLQDIPEEIEALATETLLLSNGFSRFLARQAFAATPVKPDEADIELLAKIICAAQDSGETASGPSFQGTLPEAVALGRYKACWYPLILEWQACYYPDLDIMCSQPDFKNWMLQGEDYVFASETSPITPGNEYTIEGRLMISDNASGQLKSMVRRRLSVNKNAVDAVRSVSLLSQALNGFNNALMMRERTLPPAVFTTDEEEKPLIDALSALDPATLGDRPLFDLLFSPIRAGFMSLARVRIIDVLGRYQDIASPSVYASESMRAPSAQNPIQNPMLPPRLLQPTRLHAFWICAGKGRRPTEASFVDTASPLCGFLLPNRLDHSIMVYTVKGLPAGSLNITQTGSGIDWKSPPGAPRSSVIPKDLDPEMYAFLTGLRDNGPKALECLIEYLNKLVFNIHPGSHAVHSIEFIGRPIALARISIKLEMLGDKELYRHNEDGGEPDKTSGTDVTNAMLLTKLGRLEDPGDGMVGFFEDGNYGQIHIFKGVAPASVPQYFIPDNSVQLPANQAAPSKIITLLQEPWAELNLTTGILPVKILHLPEELVNASLNNIATTFLAAPVLSGSKQITVPIPHSDDLSFNWEYMSDYDRWESAGLEYADAEVLMDDYPQRVLEGYVEIKDKEAGHD